MASIPKSIEVPIAVLNKIKTIDNDLNEEDITVKGYCKQAWAILEKFIPENIAEEIKKIQKSILHKEIDEVEGYLQLFDLLCIENIIIKKVLSSTENILEPNGSSQSLSNAVITENVNKRKSTNKDNKITKKMKTNNLSSVLNEITLPNKESETGHCHLCQQYLNNVLIYKSHPKNAVEEFVALTDPKLLLFTGEEAEVHSYDYLPHNKITNFSVYDKEGHLCSFDSGLIEKNVCLYFSGYLKPIYDEDPSPKDGIAVKDAGPINEWWLSGFDGGEKALVGFSTSYGEYYLMNPSKEYKLLMNPLQKKIYISKIVIEFLLKKSWQDPTYEDLLDHLQFCAAPEKIGKITEEDLLSHSQFVCDQITNMDKEENEAFLETSCMKSLVDLSGVTFKENNTNQKEQVKKPKINKRRSNWSKATTTELVRNVFESFFPEQLDHQNNDEKYMNDDLDDNFTSIPRILKKNLSIVEWVDGPLVESCGRTFYKSAQIGKNIVVKSGDYVILKTDRKCSSVVAKIIYMWDELLIGKMFHAHLFCGGIHTILREISDPLELFELDDCEDCPLGAILQKTKVENHVNKNTYFCKKRYDKKRARFEDLSKEEEEDFDFKFCAACERKSIKKKYEIPILDNGVIYWRNDKFQVGSGVYLVPGTFNFKFPNLNPIKIEKDEPVDEDIYPEYYRKKSDTTTGIEISEPFCIGYIREILTQSSKKSEDIQLKVQKLYRPENTLDILKLSQQEDLNLLYWSNEQLVVNFSKVTGKCYIALENLLDVPVRDWSQQGPDRFYFSLLYNADSHEYVKVDDNFISLYKDQTNLEFLTNSECWFKLDKPLRTMDVFAGCGGFSEGLHQSGVADTRWAIEKDETAAAAYKLNNPNTIVYSADCNDLLNEVISGSKSKNTLPLPNRDDVELLVGGPPCQGFSGMNRFNAGQYSLFKNSLIVSFLSYCDFYRPRFFILENVRNFVTFKKSMVLKLTLKCLLSMGYQCTFGILQAGNYGVPQIRRRLILIAAAPGEILPEYPEPLHVFQSKRANQLDIVIDNLRYNTGSKWLTIGAPYRTITVQDAISDLPEIQSGCTTQNQNYDNKPLSHFQRQMRTHGEQTLRDHICKEMSPIVEARMKYIPVASGSDWRDLPNIVIRLSDGTFTNKLQYKFDDKKNGKNSKGSFRGVCPCASQNPCDSSERQFNTLIPWCLPHTANRHNNWTGLYGRLEWNGVFYTTVTIPEPISKQGRVLHPTQHRVVSVRECARSQGFPDKYRFVGNLIDKHRQVGNAVPPPLGKAIGLEIMKAIVMNANSK